MAGIGCKEALELGQGGVAQSCDTNPKADITHTGTGQGKNVRQKGRKPAGILPNSEYWAQILLTLRDLAPKEKRAWIC